MSVLGFINRKPNRISEDASLNKVLDSLSDVVMVIDHDLCISYVNTCWEILTSVKKNRAQGSLFSGYLHPEDHIAWHEAARNVSESGEAVQLWLRLLTKDNGICWCEVRLQPLSSDHAFPLTATLCDITSQVQHDKIMAANNRNLSGLLNRMPAMLYRGRNDTRWTMEYISDGCTELTGYTRDQLLNQPQLSIGALIHPEDAGRVWETVQESLQQHQCFELNYRLMHADGDYRHVTEKGTGIYSITGAVLSIEGVILNLESYR